MAKNARKNMERNNERSKGLRRTGSLDKEGFIFSNTKQKQ